MLIRNKNIQKIVARTLLVFLCIAIIEYVVILLLRSNPIILFKAQAIMLVTTIAFLIHTGYKVWFIYDLDHPLRENGSDESLEDN